MVNVNWRSFGLLLVVSTAVVLANPGLINSPQGNEPLYPVCFNTSAFPGKMFLWEQLSTIPYNGDELPLGGWDVRTYSGWMIDVATQQKEAVLYGTSLLRDSLVNLHVTPLNESLSNHIITFHRTGVKNDPWNDRFYDETLMSWKVWDGLSEVWKRIQINSQQCDFGYGRENIEIVDFWENNNANFEVSLAGTLDGGFGIVWKGNYYDSVPGAFAPSTYGAKVDRWGIIDVLTEAGTVDEISTFPTGDGSYGFRGFRNPGGFVSESVYGPPWSQNSLLASFPQAVALDIATASNGDRIFAYLEPTHLHVSGAREVTIATTAAGVSIQKYPQIAINPALNRQEVGVVWIERDTNIVKHQAYAQVHSMSSVSSGTKFPLGEPYNYNLAPLPFAEVAALRYGGYVAVYPEYVATNVANVYAQIFDKTTISEKILLKTISGVLVGPNAKVAATEDGGFVVTSVTSSRLSVAAKMFDFRGNPKGDWFLVAPAGAGIQYYSNRWSFDITGLRGGGFAVGFVYENNTSLEAAVAFRRFDRWFAPPPLPTPQPTCPFPDTTPVSALFSTNQWTITHDYTAATIPVNFFMDDIMDADSTSPVIPRISMSDLSPRIERAGDGGYAVVGLGTASKPFCKACTREEEAACAEGSPSDVKTHTSTLVKTTGTTDTCSTMMLNGRTGYRCLNSNYDSGDLVTLDFPHGTINGPVRLLSATVRLWVAVSTNVAPEDLEIQVGATSYSNHLAVQTVSAQADNTLVCFHVPYPEDDTGAFQNTFSGSGTTTPVLVSNAHPSALFYIIKAEYFVRYTTVGVDAIAVQEFQRTPMCPMAVSQSLLETANSFNLITNIRYQYDSRTYPRSKRDHDPIPGVEWVAFIREEKTTARPGFSFHMRRRSAGETWQTYAFLHKNVSVASFDFTILHDRTPLVVYSPENHPDAADANALVLSDADRILGSLGTPLGNAWLPTESIVRMMYYHSANDNNGNSIVLFEDMDICRGAKISDATIEFMTCCGNVQSLPTNGYRMEISIYPDNDASSGSSGSPYVGNMSWSTQVLPNAVGVLFSTPDISSVIQELTDLEELHNVKAMKFSIENLWGYRRYATRADDNGGFAPTLRFKYSCPAPFYMHPKIEKKTYFPDPNRKDTHTDIFVVAEGRTRLNQADGPDATPGTRIWGNLLRYRTPSKKLTSLTTNQPISPYFDFPASFEYNARFPDITATQKNGWAIVYQYDADLDERNHPYGYLYRPDMKERTATLTDALTVEPINVTETARESTTGVIAKDVDFALGLNWIGLRFEFIGIPQGAIIDSASIEFSTRDPFTPDNYTSLHIYGNDADSAAPWRTSNAASFDISRKRLKTQASVYWENIAQFPVYGTVDTPSLSEIVQEIVDRPNWQPQNAMMFMFSPAGGGSEQFRNVYGGVYVDNTTLTVSWSRAKPKSPTSYIRFVNWEGTPLGDVQPLDVPGPDSVAESPAVTTLENGEVLAFYAGRSRLPDKDGPTPETPTYYGGYLQRFRYDWRNGGHSPQKVGPPVKITPDEHDGKIITGLDITSLADCGYAAVYNVIEPYDSDQTHQEYQLPLNAVNNKYQPWKATNFVTIDSSYRTCIRPPNDPNAQID